MIEEQELDSEIEKLRERLNELVARRDAIRDKREREARDDFMRMQEEACRELSEKRQWPMVYWLASVGK